MGVLANRIGNEEANTPPNIISSSDGIYIPKIELPKETNAKIDMIGLIVYQGRIYTQTGTRINNDDAVKLLGEKLGRAKGNLNEWSKQTDYAVEFASSTGEWDVYSVKGYDKSFRIMTYANINGDIYPGFYECINGITVKKGEDIFRKLKIDNNIKSGKYEKFESWNYGKQEYTELKNLQTLNSFVTELNNTTPYAQQSLSYLFNEEGNSNRKFVNITLNDGCQVTLSLFKDGYIYYDYSHVIFKMEHEVFDKLWAELE
jgi:hypothetical protein